MKTHIGTLLAVAIGIGALGIAPARTSGTMKAIQYSELGPSSVLKYVDVPRPAPAAGEVLVRVNAASVNPIDRKKRKGPPGTAIPAPVIPGYDFSGAIAALGAGVSGHEVGEHVFAMLPLDSPGAYAEYVVIPAALVARMPNNVSPVQAAAVPLAALTAYQALFDTGHLTRGQTVLIHGAAGGVGHFAVQLAKQAGATVIGTASASNLAFVKQIGADKVIDYRAQKFEDVAANVDLVLDTVGGDTLKRSYAVVKAGGALVTIAGAPDMDAIGKRGIHGGWMLVKPDAAELGKIAELIEHDELTPAISATYPLKDAALAHDTSESGHPRGKLVLRIDPGATPPARH